MTSDQLKVIYILIDFVLKSTEGPIHIPCICTSIEWYEY